MAKFKAGDRVQFVRGHYQGIGRLKYGDIAIVQEENSMVGSDGQEWFHFEFEGETNPDGVWHWHGLASDWEKAE